MATRIGVIVLVGSLIGLTSSSTCAARWSRPVTVGHEGRLGPLSESRLAASPDGRRVDLVTAGAPTGVVLRPWLRDSSFGAPVRVRRRERYRVERPLVAVNDAGAAVVSWVEVDPSPEKEPSEGIDECFCAVRATVVHGNDGRSGPTTTLAPASGPLRWLLGAAIGPGADASVLWAEEPEEPAGSERTVRRNMLAESAPGGGFLPALDTGPSSIEPVLQEVDGRPQVISARFKEPGSGMYIAARPFEERTLIGKGSSFALGAWPLRREVVGDPRGDELLISTGGNRVRVSYRPAGATFGPPRTIARLNKLHGECSVGAAMNEHGETIATWVCYTEPPASMSFGQAALLGRGGVLKGLTLRHRTSGRHEGRPAAAINNHGQGIVALELPSERGFLTLAAKGGHFLRPDTIEERFNPESVAVAVTASGTALATWSSQVEGHSPRIRFAYSHT